VPGDPDHLATLIPIGRLGTPEEVADLAMAIISNGYVTNQVVGINGGLHRHSRSGTRRPLSIGGPARTVVP